MANSFAICCFCFAFSIGVYSVDIASRSEPTEDNQPTDGLTVENLRTELRRSEETSPKGGRNRRCDGGLGAVVAQLVSDLTTVHEKLLSMESKLQATGSKLEATESKLEATKTELESKLTRSEITTRQIDQGSTFVRWGRTTCPNNASLVYSGVVGGKGFGNKGSGPNRLCLTRTPQFDNVVSVPASYGYIYGAEYQEIPGHNNHDVPCSVCRASQSTTIMVPGTLTCLPGWTTQYTGHVISANDGHFATEYVCLDASPENDLGGEANTQGHLVYHVVAQCGTLPCPPYVHNKVITCVVCSK